MQAIYDARVEDLVNPLGIDTPTPRFSWKISSPQKGVLQEKYKITVAADAEFKAIVWDSGWICDRRSFGIKYSGQKLCSCTRYYWRAGIVINGEQRESETAWFETAFMGTQKNVWKKAKWIGAPIPTVNTDALDRYLISATVKGDRLGAVFSARNRDNFMISEFDFLAGKITFREHSDDAWGDTKGYIKTLAEYEICKSSGQEHKIEIVVENRNVKIKVDAEQIFAEEIIPEDIVNRPRRAHMMMFGFRQYGSSIAVSKLVVKNTDTNVVYLKRENFKVDNEFYLDCAVGAVNVRKEIDFSGEVASARLYAAARGFYTAYINGRRVDDSFYNPGFTDYRKRIYYQTFDVSDMVRDSKICIGATIAKGYYSGYVGYSAKPMVYGEQNSFIAILSVRYIDGREEIFATDKSWQYTDRGALICSDYQQGEYYDARRELDWNDFFDARWQPCGVIAQQEFAQPTNGILRDIKFELEAQKGPSARIFTEISPVRLYEQPAGHLVYDFGQNIVGTVRICVQGRRGSAVKLRYGEMCAADGAVYVKNLRTAASTDVYVLKGDAEGEYYMPEFTSHGFRYLEISGEGCTIDKMGTVKSAVGIVITNTQEMCGEFSCSNELINKLYSNIVWGQRGNSLLVFTDCPQRNERMGWTGDGQVFMKTAAYNMRVKAFCEKWLADIRDAQMLYNRNGAVPDTAPLGGDNRVTGGCGGWGDAAVIVPWVIYCTYGDKAVLEENYDMMAAWVDYQNREDRRNYGLRTVDGTAVPEKSDLAEQPYIQIQQSRGDHLSFDESTPFILSATAYAAYAAKLMSEIAAILNKDDDAKKYQKRFRDIKKAFNDAWVRDDGTIAYYGEMSKDCADINGAIINQTYYSEEADNPNKPSQTAYALAIDFGLIPKKKLHRAEECLVRSIRDRDSKLSVGFLGISHLAPALAKTGNIDLAYQLLEQEEYPSWLYSVKNGATTIWERWNSYIAETDTFGDVSMNSFNHYAYGAIGEWLFDTVLGISCDEKSAGYLDFVLKPQPGGKLSYAKGKFDSPNGVIESGWDLTGGKLKYKCVVPANTTARLYLPEGRRYKLPDGCKQTDDGAVLLVSGEYIINEI